MTNTAANFTEIDLKRLRGDTPGLSERVHLDNCGSALMPLSVIEAQQRYFELEIQYGGYVAQEQQSEGLARVYASLSTLLGGKTSDYAITSSAVDAWTKAFYSISMGPGDNIVTAYTEYCANYVAFLQRAKRDGIEIRVARAGEDGTLDLAQLDDLVDSRTKVIAVTHIPSSSGQVLPVDEIGKIAKAKDVLYLLDACQSVGQLPVNFEAIGCDMATGTSRKFLRGPRGIGFLYINEKARGLIEPVVLTNQAATWTGDNTYSMRDDAGVFEAWERSCVNQMGFGAAVDYLLEQGVEKMTGQVRVLSDHLRAGLRDIPGVTPTCQADARAGIITFNKVGLKATEVKSALEKQGIAVQVAGIVHTRLDLGARGIENAVRLSPHYYNSTGELDQFLTALEAL
ncbi:MAG: aminotransferase class V-fold PLP-dependent enzyme [Kordiimonadaceae bacterium]|nr:aminotransferase class V-fold PLP-dependent enzyme [Kordiimonadaceae bacterium]